jgi:predicted MFS family arabinose efflux permease
MKLGSREVQIRKVLAIAALGVAGICGVAAGGTAVQAEVPAAPAAGPDTVHITARLTVTYTAPPVCTAGVCVIANQGTGTLAPYGPVTFTTMITADGNQPPCGATSQWVNQIIRTITTSKGTLVLHEAGLQCPLPGIGPQVKAVWAVDGADSTGIFHGARGQGSDTAYPALDTASPQGTLILAP